MSANGIHCRGVFAEFALPLRGDEKNVRLTPLLPPALEWSHHPAKARDQPDSCGDDADPGQYPLRFRFFLWHLPALAVKAHGCISGNRLFAGDAQLLSGCGRSSIKGGHLLKSLRLPARAALSVPLCPEVWRGLYRSTWEDARQKLEAGINGM